VLSNGNPRDAVIVLMLLSVTVEKHSRPIFLLQIAMVCLYDCSVNAMISLATSAVHNEKRRAEYTPTAEERNTR